MILNRFLSVCVSGGDGEGGGRFGCACMDKRLSEAGVCKHVNTSVCLNLMTLTFDLDL